MLSHLCGRGTIYKEISGRQAWHQRRYCRMWWILSCPAVFLTSAVLLEILRHSHKEPDEAACAGAVVKQRLWNKDSAFVSLHQHSVWFCACMCVCLDAYTGCLLPGLYVSICCLHLRCGKVKGWPLVNVTCYVFSSSHSASPASAVNNCQATTDLGGDQIHTNVLTSNVNLVPPTCRYSTISDKCDEAHNSRLTPHF